MDCEEGSFPVSWFDDGVDLVFALGAVPCTSGPGGPGPPVGSVVVSEDEVVAWAIDSGGDPASGCFCLVNVCVNGIEVVTEEDNFVGLFVFDEFVDAFEFLVDVRDDE